MGNWFLFLFFVIDNKKLTAATQTEPVPSRIDRMPLDVPVDTYTSVGTDAVFAVHTAADSSATEVALLAW